MAGVKGRSGGARPGAGRPPGTRNPATVERDTAIATIAGAIPHLSQRVDSMLTHVEGERQMRRHQAELLPTILRRLTEIEKHLALRESHQGPRQATSRVFRDQPQSPGPMVAGPIARPQPQPKHAAAEALFRQGGNE